MNINRTLRMAIIAVCAVLLQVALVNCERVNDVSQSDEQMPKIVSNWQIINDRYVDEYGNVGQLFKVSKNPEQFVFLVLSTTKASSDCPDPTGTFSDGYTNGVYWWKCEAPAKNCVKISNNECRYNYSCWDKDIHIKPKN